MWDMIVHFHQLFAHGSQVQLAMANKGATPCDIFVNHLTEHGVVTPFGKGSEGVERCKRDYDSDPKGQKRMIIDAYVDVAQQGVDFDDVQGALAHSKELHLIQHMMLD